MRHVGNLARKSQPDYWNECRPDLRSLILLGNASSQGASILALDHVISQVIEEPCSIAK
jgi:hypothetical protein